jgi:hypothetical protein
MPRFCLWFTQCLYPWFDTVTPLETLSLSVVLNIWARGKMTLRIRGVCEGLLVLVRGIVVYFPVNAFLWKGWSSSLSQCPFRDTDETLPVVRLRDCENRFSSQSGTAVPPCSRSNSTP